MNKLRKNRKVLFTLATVVILLPFFALAAGGVIENPVKADTFAKILYSIIDFLQKIGAVVAVIMVLYAGYLYMTGGSNRERLKTAHKTLVWSLIGLGVLLIGKGWVTIVCNFLETKC